MDMYGCQKKPKFLDKPLPVYLLVEHRKEENRWHKKAIGKDAIVMERL